jgi:hypothetical protein
VLIDGQTMQAVYLPGVVIPNAAGAPNLPAPAATLPSRKAPEPA